jgi:hypothetical protein
MVSSLDPLQVFYLMQHYGSIERTSEQLGYAPRSLSTIARRPHNWRIQMAIDWGLCAYRQERARHHAGESVVSFKAGERADRCRGR